MWEREDEFRSLLRRAAKKATKDILDSLADIAIRDDKLVGAQKRMWRCSQLLPLSTAERPALAQPAHCVKGA